MPADVIVMTDRPAGEGGASVFEGGFDQGAQMPESPFGGGVTIRNREKRKILLEEWQRIRDTVASLGVE